MKSLKKSKGLEQWMEALPYILPSLILISLFVIYPLLKNIKISFYNYDILQNKTLEFIGFRNYKKLFTSNEFFLALRNSVIYTFFTVLGQLFLGLLLANLINNTRKGQTFFKVVTYLPVVTSWVVISLLFRNIFSAGKSGLINYFLQSIHLISNPISWFQNVGTANFVLCVFGIWKGVGWTMLIYFAALQGISKTLYEAAVIDGASSIQRFYKITLPLVKNTTLYLLTVLTIGGFGAYIHVMMITQGGPMGQTRELMNMVYDTAFISWNFSYASTQAVIMGLMIFLLSFVQRKITREMEN
ncbi:MAG: sugar ABC transporter permease [Sphaerochaetaceae bacterium]|nr:sugar ABC transporter permease [Sphaerochaetaceae bacterium]